MKREGERPFCEFRINKYISAQIQALDSIKSKERIARECGLSSVRFIDAIASGEMRVPLGMLLKISIALGVSLRLLAGLALEDLCKGDDAALTEWIKALDIPRSISIDSEMVRDVPVEEIESPTENYSTESVNLNFKVTPMAHRRFRMEASSREISMKELFERCFAAFLEMNSV